MIKIPFYSIKQKTARGNQRKLVEKLLLEGMSNAEIAKQLLIQEKTVRFHITNIFKATGCKTRTQFIVKHYKSNIEQLNKQLLEMSYIDMGMLPRPKNHFTLG